MVETYFSNQWAIVLGVVFAALVLLDLFHRKAHYRLMIPRALWLGGIVWILADWMWVDSKEWSEPETLYLFYDRSDSITKIPQRAEKLDLFLSEFEAWAEENDQPVRLFSFAEEVQEESFSEYTKGGYQSFLDPVASFPLESDTPMIVVSDGQWSDHPRFDRPVYFLSLAEQEVSDVWIESVQPVFTAFLRNRLTIPVEIGQRGFSGQEVEVTLFQGSQKLESRRVGLEQENTIVEFEYFPERMGESIFIVEVESAEGQVSDLNDRRSFYVRTVRDKIQVLHINGKPSVDLKAWRLFLTRQPDVDLVSFYILRSLRDDPQARNHELSLIPFPYEDLFTTELEKFDVVMLQNFDFNLYFQPFYLRNLQNFIQGGGALLIFGGDQSLQNYKRSPLEQVFPFSYGPQQGRFERADVGAEVLNEHPVIDGLEWSFEEPMWNTRHKIKPRHEATDLVRFETGEPFISLRDVGDGRVLAINTDESWRLHYEPIGDYAPFSRLARRILQYLTFDPEMEPKRILSSEWKVGQNVRLELSSGEVADWELVSLLSRREEKQRFEAKEKIEYFVEEPGVYEVVVDDGTIRKTYETEQKPWLQEWKYLLPDHQKMQDRAKQTEGAFHFFSNREELFNQEISGRQVVFSSSLPWFRSSPFFGWLVLIAILGLLSLDFFLRKKYQWEL